MVEDRWISTEFVEGLVSVIIPTYNRALLLTDAIESIVNQSYRPIECIIVDDGSTDGTKVLVESFSQNNSSSFSVIYVHQDNAGPQAARNKGTLISRGEFIQYLDSDDLLHTDKLTNQVNFLRDDIDCDGVFGDWEIGDSMSKELLTAHKEANMIEQIFTGSSIANFSFLMRRSIIQKTGVWDVNLKTCHETDYHLTALIRGACFKYQTLICGLWRSHEGERFENTTRLVDIANYFDKWELILKKENKWNESLANKIGHLLIWFLQQNNFYDKKATLRILKKAVAANPDILGFNKSRKYKFLSSLIGEELAFSIWSSDFRKSLISNLKK